LTVSRKKVLRKGLTEELDLLKKTELKKTEEADI
jgi:hypothetical protein